MMAAPVRAMPASTAVSAAEHLHEARSHERVGNVTEAMTSYRGAITEARRTSAWAVEAEALRRLAVLHHQRGEPELANEACERSLTIARRNADAVLEAEVLKAQGAFALDHGDFETARAAFERALAVAGGGHPALNAGVEGNLGILANVHGDFEGALEHYRRSLVAYQSAGDDHGCAQAYHNLGMISADREAWDEADGYFAQSRAIAEALGEQHLVALCLLNHAEVDVARQQFDRAKRRADQALAIFDRLDSVLDKPDAYRVLGTVYRATNRHALSESRLRAAIELAAKTRSVLSEAEAARELALLYQLMGRNQEALRLLNTAHGLFRRLDARVDLIDASRKVMQLEETFLAVVRDWGQSIESADSYTFGHCERVARFAEQLARALRLDEHEITTIRLGAYLHDVGKIRVPHEVLNKPGRLTPEEFEVIKLHPIWGVELLEAVDFPWDIKPIIRWHHEKYDGTGYPDRRRGDEIPLSAVIIGIVDVFDALTTTRSYRPAMPVATALAEMAKMRGSWRPDVYEAFTRTIAAETVEQLSVPADRAA